MKIKCITLVNSKGKGQTVTLEEARELYESLDEIFGPKREFKLTSLPYDGPCKACNGKGCVACDARFLPEDIDQENR